MIFRNFSANYLNRGGNYTLAEPEEIEVSTELTVLMLVH
jgi:hypothetical protein